MQQSARDRELLAHPFRERTDRLVAAVPELEKMEIALDLRIGSRSLEVVEPCEVAEVLSSREPIVEARLLGEDPD